MNRPLEKGKRLGRPRGEMVFESTASVIWILFQRSGGVKKRTVEAPSKAKVYRM